jgi:hypothetical protein
MNERQDALAWAQAEFGTVPRLEKRWRDRLVQTAATLAQQPDGSLPQHFDWAELKGLYRLVRKVEDQPDLLQQVHRQRTRQRMTAATPVLIIHDTTLSWTSARTRSCVTCWGRSAMTAALASSSTTVWPSTRPDPPSSA